MIRTTASAIAISIALEISVGGGEDIRGDDIAAPAITTGAKACASSQIPGEDNCLPCRRRGVAFATDRIAGAVLPTSWYEPLASRRHANNCWGLSPWRRATSDTLTPSSRLSTTMRALSSLDHRRRRPAPVISSIRRTAVALPSRRSALLSSLRSSVMSKSSLMGRHYATTRTLPKCGNERPLTPERAVCVRCGHVAPASLACDA